jgi:hypothetical protein
VAKAGSGNLQIAPSIDMMIYALPRILRRHESATRVDSERSEWTLPVMMVRMLRPLLSRLKGSGVRHEPMVGAGSNSWQRSVYRDDDIASPHVSRVLRCNMDSAIYQFRPYKQVKR